MSIDCCTQCQENKTTVYWGIISYFLFGYKLQDINEEKSINSFLQFLCFLKGLLCHTPVNIKMSAWFLSVCLSVYNNSRTWTIVVKFWICGVSATIFWHIPIFYLKLDMWRPESSLFWDVKRRKLLVVYRRFRTTYRFHLLRRGTVSIFKQYLTLEDGTYRLSRNVGNEVPTHAT